MLSWLPYREGKVTASAANITLLRAAIEASGLSITRWAREVAWRDERTVRRWLAGETPIPGVVLSRIREPQKIAPCAKRKKVLS